MINSKQAEVLRQIEELREQIIVAQRLITAPKVLVPNAENTGGSVTEITPENLHEFPELVKLAQLLKGEQL